MKYILSTLLLMVPYLLKAQMPDSACYTVIKYTGEEFGHLPPGLYPANLSADDLATIYKLYQDAITTYNTRFFLIRPKGNCLQIIAAVDNNGDKIAWINCFCDNPHRPHEWKENILMSLDGGSCYFNFNISLKTKTFSNFVVNNKE